MGVAIAPTKTRAETDMETLIGATEVLLATAVTTACFVVLRRRHTT